MLTYYRNGHKKSFGQWEQGYKFGVWRYFNEVGDLVKRGVFNEYGYRDGVWLERDSLGLTDSITIYVNGYIDTAYRVDVDTLNLDSIIVNPLNLDSVNLKEIEEYIEPGSPVG